MRILLSCLFVLIACTSFAQSRKEKKAAKEDSQSNQPTTLDPADTEEEDAPKVSKRRDKVNKPTYNSQKEFEERMAARSKTYRKNEKNLMTPQYANPAYFGHKRPPKKRPANRMKFCKECGIRH